MVNKPKVSRMYSVGGWGIELHPDKRTVRIYDLPTGSDLSEHDVEVGIDMLPAIYDYLANPESPSAQLAASQERVRVRVLEDARVKAIHSLQDPVRTPLEKINDAYWILLDAQAALEKEK